MGGRATSSRQIQRFCWCIRRSIRMDWLGCADQATVSRLWLQDCQGIDGTAGRTTQSQRGNDSKEVMPGVLAAQSRQRA